MTITNLAPHENRLLKSLPRLDREHLLANGEVVNLEFAAVLCESGRQIQHIYFPTESIVSLVVSLPGHSGLEVGLVGDEGMLGLPLLLGVAVWPFRGVVQGAGAAWRIDAVHFQRELEASVALHACLNRFLYVSMRHLAQSAACARFHVVENRLAKWLLMTQDRAHSDAFVVTQEFMAYMLGVRRVGVTKAASILQRKKLIEYKRGHIIVLDRAGLESAACGCYLADVQEYEQYLGNPANPGGPTPVLA